MDLSLYFVADGRLHLFEEGAVRELPNGILDRTRERLLAAARRGEWKTGSRIGEEFPGIERSAEERAAELCSTIGGLAEYDGRTVFSLSVDEASGIYAKATPDDTNEGILYSHANYRFGSLSPMGEDLLVSVGVGNRSHIALLHDRTLEFLTDGNTQDAYPAADPRGNRFFYFSSAGLAEQAPDENRPQPTSFPEMMARMSKDAALPAVGPAALLRMDKERLTITEVLTDPSYDHLRPTVTPDGTLYYLRRPYQGTPSGNGGLGCLLDILLLPWRLLRGLFGFLNVFTMTYSGKSLKNGTSVAKGRSEREEYLEGNRFEAAKELKKNRKDPFPGIVPHSYELRKRTAGGEDTLVARGVYAYALHGDTVVYSNGSALLCRHPDGTREKLADVRRITAIL